MPKRRSTTQQAIDFLTYYVEKAVLNNGDKLPSTDALAKAANLSRTAIMAAIRILHHKGHIDVRSRVGIFVGSAKAHIQHEAQSIKPIRSIEQLAQRITQDIIDGKFAQSERLPSYKELCHTYSSSYRTLRKVLAVLTLRDRIKSSKRSYRIIRHGVAPAGSTIAFIHGSEFSTLIEASYFKSWFYVFLNSIEKECAQRRLRMQWLLHSDGADWQRGMRESLGYIVWIDQSLKNNLADLVRSLIRFDKPIVLIDENRYTLPALPASARITIVRINNRQAGNQIGKFLLEEGHRSICFLARTHEPYANERLKGVREAFGTSGIPDTSVAGLFLSDLPGSNPHAAEDVAIMRNLQSEHLKIEEEIAQLDAGITDAGFKKGFLDHLADYRYELYLRYSLIPLFRAAMNERASAWVVLDDYLAVYGALPFLRKQRIAVPSDISIVSFGNMIEAFKHDITSFSFDMAAMTGRIMDALFTGNRRAAASVNRIEPVPGFLSVRGSTRRVR